MKEMWNVFVSLAIHEYNEMIYQVRQPWASGGKGKAESVDITR